MKITIEFKTPEWLKKYSKLYLEKLKYLYAKLKGTPKDKIIELFMWLFLIVFYGAMSIIGLLFTVPLSYLFYCILYRSLIK